MLVISRKRDQQIRIGDNITITVVDVRGGLVRLGIKADAKTRIHRGEVWERRQQELPRRHWPCTHVRSSPLCTGLRHIFGIFIGHSSVELH